jgi:hypothetical protein
MRSMLLLYCVWIFFIGLDTRNEAADKARLHLDVSD